jgi:hypothetical protein
MSRVEHIGRAVTGLGEGKSNEWYTPPSLFRSLGCRFDLDVAAPEAGPLHVPCERWIWRDSLSEPWAGFVWMNPPFEGRNGLKPWLSKFFDHGDGIALTPDRTSSPWFRYAWSRADGLLFAGRTPFLKADGMPVGNPAFGTALWATGNRAAEILTRAAENGFGMLCGLRRFESDQPQLFEAA